MIRIDQDAIEQVATELKLLLPRWEISEPEKLAILTREDYCHLAELLGLHINNIYQADLKKTAQAHY